MIYEKPNCELSLFGDFPGLNQRQVRFDALLLLGEQREWHPAHKNPIIQGVLLAEPRATLENKAG